MHTANQQHDGFIFTAQDAVATFKKHAGYDFHPTVPGQLLARAGVSGIGFDWFDRRQYAGLTVWRRVWADMLALADRRASFGDGAPPRHCPAPEQLEPVKASEPPEWYPEPICLFSADDSRLRHLLEKDD